MERVATDDARELLRAPRVVGEVALVVGKLEGDPLIIKGFYDTLREPRTAISLENGLFFAATSTTYGMPMVVELGIALDVLVGTFIFGIFFFQIRETFDSLDIHHLEKLRDKS